jgi:hypothetical protein
MTFISDAPYNTLFIIYLIISCNFLGSLFNCNLQKLLTDNIYIKHIFCFLTILFSIIYVDSNIVKECKYIEGFFYAIIFYIWFVLTTKTNIYITLIILMLLLIVYILQLHINVISNQIELNEENEEKEELNEEKKELYEEQKQNQIKLNKTIDNIKLSQYIIISITFIITIIGFIYYYISKKKKYQKNWDTLTFIFGKNKCMFNNNNKELDETSKN